MDGVRYDRLTDLTNEIMAIGKADILEFYERFARSDGWESLDALRAFVPRLFRERDLAGCTVFTSHATLCIVRYPTYPEWCDKPLLSIVSTTKDRLHMEFVITRESGRVYRAVTETVNCPLESGLAEFDRLYSKFLKAHDATPADGEG